MALSGLCKGCGSLLELGNEAADPGLVHKRNMLDLMKAANRLLRTYELNGFCPELEDSIASLELVRDNVLRDLRLDSR